jgi:hypothetical protein
MISTNELDKFIDDTKLPSIRTECGDEATFAPEYLKQAIQSLIAKEKNALLDRLLEQAETFDTHEHRYGAPTTKAVPVETIKAERTV